MNPTRPVKLILFLTCLLATSSSQAFSLLEWLGLKEKPAQESVAESAQPTKAPNWADSKTPDQEPGEDSNAAASVQPDKLGFDEVRNIVINLNESERKQLLGDEQAFGNFIQSQAANKSVLAAARANNVHTEPATRLLMQISADNTLREIYIKRLINKELPEDFPSEEQARTFYENNPGQFTLEERFHVWQVFLPFGTDADAPAREKIKQQAAAFRKSIQDKKVSFESIATDHSQHIPSRHTGGYMGLIKLSDIKPEIRESVLSLGEGIISEPVMTDAGYHLIKRGEKIEATVLPFEQVRARIDQALRQEAGRRLRQAIFEQASKTYSQNIDAKRIEEWRLKLRTNL